MTKPGSSAERKGLHLRASECAGSSAFLLYLSGEANNRLSLNQAAFFMLVASAHASGQKVTLAQVKELGGDKLNDSVRNSYKILLDKSRSYPTSLGWLKREPNPDDERESFLSLTPKGEEIVADAMEALKKIR